MASKISFRVTATERTGSPCSFSNSLHCIGSVPVKKPIEIRKICHGQVLSAGICSSSEGFLCISLNSRMFPVGHRFLRFSAGTRGSEAKECTRNSEDCENASRYQF